MTNHNYLISPEELNQLLQLNSKDFAIFDCRFDLANVKKGLELYLQGHIPGAVYVDLEKDLSGGKSPLLGRHPLPEPSVWSSTISKLGISKSTLIILYDQQENIYSARMWWMLKAVGLNNVRILNGGFSNWVNFGGDVSTLIEEPQPTLQEIDSSKFDGLVKMIDI